MPTLEEPAEPDVEAAVAAVATVTAIPSGRFEELRQSLDAIRDATAQRQRDFAVLQNETLSLRERTIEARARRAEHLRRLREAARR
jgi:hypothetical protein